MGVAEKLAKASAKHGDVVLREQRFFANKHGAPTYLAHPGDKAKWV